MTYEIRRSNRYTQSLAAIAEAENLTPSHIERALISIWHILAHSPESAPLGESIGETAVRSIPTELHLEARPDGGLDAIPPLLITFTIEGMSMVFLRQIEKRPGFGLDDD